MRSSPRRRQRSRRQRARAKPPMGNAPRGSSARRGRLSAAASAPHLFADDGAVRDAQFSGKPRNPTLTLKTVKLQYNRSGDTLQQTTALHPQWLTPCSKRHTGCVHNPAPCGYGQGTILPWPHQAVHRTTMSTFVVFFSR